MRSFHVFEQAVYARMLGHNNITSAGAEIEPPQGGAELGGGKGDGKKRHPSGVPESLEIGEAMASVWGQGDIMHFAPLKDAADRQGSELQPVDLPTSTFFCPPGRAERERESTDEALYASPLNAPCWLYGATLLELVVGMHEDRVLVSSGVVGTFPVPSNSPMQVLTHITY